LTTNKDTASAKIWQGDRAGLREKLEEAQRLDDQHRSLEANVMRASAWYSCAGNAPSRWEAFRAFSRGRQFAERAVRLLALESDHFVTGDQLDVMGTIVLRQFLWIRAKPHEALRLFYAGLKKPAMPHTKALIHMGIAEARDWLGEKVAARNNMEIALSLEELTLTEPNPIDAKRQLSRVMRRAAVLSWKYGNKPQAEVLHKKARRYAIEGDASSQVDKLDGAWARLQNPKLWHRFLPQ
jgi:hypothetical protein